MLSQRIKLGRRYRRSHPAKRGHLATPSGSRTGRIDIRGAGEKRGGRERERERELILGAFIRRSHLVKRRG